MIAASDSTGGAGTVLWLTGLSGAGKSTLASALAPALAARGRKVEALDGDALREHLCRGLGFTREDRDENVRRIAFVAHLLAKHGVDVLVSAISPYRAARAEARAMTPRFVEIHVAPPLEECVRRDVKGLYRRALAGELASFTGVSDPYEEPLDPEVRVDTSVLSLDASVSLVVRALEARGYLSAAPTGAVTRVA